MTSIAPIPLPVNSTKRCVYCKVEKPLQAFYRHSVRKDGYASRCKACWHIPGKPRAAAQPLVERTCEYCGRSFKAKPAEVRKGAGRYCSIPCKNAANTRPFAERFWALVDKSGGPDTCWPWLGKRTKFGHGLVSHAPDGHGHTAHRIAYELTHGPLGPGRLACHKCPGGDNPACCNPAHLYNGSWSDNNRDTNERGAKAQKRAQLRQITPPNIQH